MLYTKPTSGHQTPPPGVCTRESRHSDTLYVATGPVFQKQGGSESVTWILPNADSKRAPVPNYYWKVLLKVNRDGNGNVTSARSIGFWLPHKDLKDEDMDRV